MCAASTSYTCSSSAIAQQHTPEMRNSVKKPGARIYSQLRRGCSTSIKSTWSRQPGKSPQVKPESVGPAHESKLHHLAGTIPRTGTRHLFQNIESGSPHRPIFLLEILSSLGFSCKMFTPWLWACVTSPYMWLCGFPLSSQSAKRVAALGCSSYGSGKHYSLHTQNPTKAPNIHMFTRYSVHTYPVLYSDLDCEQLCSRGQCGGCSPHSYGEPCLYGAAVCVWLCRPAQPKHGHDLHPETERNLQTHQPTVLIGDRSPDLGTSRFSPNDRWQKEVTRLVEMETKFCLFVGTEECMSVGMFVVN